MFCRQCGKEVENDWVKCPYCGNELGSGSQMEGYVQYGKSMSPAPRVKKKKKWLPFIGAVAVLIVIFIMVATPSGDESYPDAEKLVKNGTYGKYTMVSIGEVLEYCWKDGSWDSFQGESDNGKSELIVEYAKDKERNTMVQFAVDLQGESFTMVNFRLDGKTTESFEEGNAEMVKVYQKYFNEKYPIHEIDLADYIEKGMEELSGNCHAFYESDKDFHLYEDVSRQVIIALDDEERFLTISITGDGAYTPMFAGNRIGDSVSRINEEELEKRGYTLSFQEDDTAIGYANPEDQSVVFFKADDNGSIASIGWTAGALTDDLMEELQGSGEEETEKTKSENTAEYIFPDSDSRYLSDDEVRNVEAEQLMLGRNEIYARHGYIFQDADIQAYFESTSWYQGTVTGEKFDDSVFNDYEKGNLEYIVCVEKALASPVNYTGGYIDGTDDDSNYIEMTQDGEYVSYKWYCRSEVVCSEDNLKINADGSVYGTYWNFWIADDGTLKAHPGVGGSENYQTFYKISGEGAIQY